MKPMQVSCSAARSVCLRARPYAEDVYVGAFSNVGIDDKRATFIVPVAAPGVTVICRKIAAREASPFSASLSSCYDEPDGQMWLDEVYFPWERVFLADQSRWLLWHHLYCWLSKAEFTLDLALRLHACDGPRRTRADDRISDRPWSPTCKPCEAASRRPSSSRNSRKRPIATPTTTTSRQAALRGCRRGRGCRKSCESCRALLGCCTKRPQPRRAPIESWARRIV